MRNAEQTSELLVVAKLADHRRALVLAIVGCTLALLGALVVLYPRTQTRASLMAQLERPAQQPLGGRGFSAAFSRPGLHGTLKYSVNRASVPDGARLAISGRGGRAIAGAHVTLTYSMPSMQMWHVYSSRLEPLAGTPGTYAATEGVLGMPGLWRIDVGVSVPGHGSERFVLRDQMPS